MQLHKMSNIWFLNASYFSPVNICIRYWNFWLIEIIIEFIAYRFICRSTRSDRVAQLEGEKTGSFVGQVACGRRFLRRSNHLMISCRLRWRLTSCVLLCIVISGTVDGLIGNDGYPIGGQKNEGFQSDVAETLFGTLSNTVDGC